MKKSNSLKIYVTCPVDSIDKVRKAVGDAGAGKIGNYSHCSYITSIGKGYFCPTPGANPTIGKIGKHEEVDEARLEFICDSAIIEDVTKAIKQAHPYEEVGFDIMERWEV